MKLIWTKDILRNVFTLQKITNVFIFLELSCQINELLALLEIAKENNKLGDEYIQDFEDSVANLKKSSSKELGITSLFSEHDGYIIFYEPENQRIIGTIKAKVDNGLVMENYSSFKRYSKGIFMGDAD